MKNLPSGRVIAIGDSAVFNDNRGLGPSPNIAEQRWIGRENNAALTPVSAAEEPISLTGNFEFVVTWRVSGVPLAIDDATLELFLDGVGTGLSQVITAAGPITGQFSGVVAVTQGAGISIGVFQSGVEVQNDWLLNVSCRAYEL